MIRNEKCEVLDKQNFEPKYRMVYDTITSDKKLRLVVEAERIYKTLIFSQKEK
jgi:hypothetical protein